MHPLTLCHLRDQVAAAMNGPNGAIDTTVVCCLLDAETLEEIGNHIFKNPDNKTRFEVANLFLDRATAEMQLGNRKAAEEICERARGIIRLRRHEQSINDRIIRILG